MRRVNILFHICNSLHQTCKHLNSNCLESGNLIYLSKRQLHLGKREKNRTNPTSGHGNLGFPTTCDVFTQKKNLVYPISKIIGNSTEANIKIIFILQKENNNKSFYT